MYLPTMHAWAEGESLRDHLDRRGVSRRQLVVFNLRPWPPAER